MSVDRAALEVERIRSLLRDAGVPVEMAPAPPSARDEEILAGILAGRLGGRAGERAVPARSLWRRPAVRVAAAAAVVVGLVVGGLAWRGGGAPAAAGVVPLPTYADASVLSVLDGTGPSARGALLRLADAAAAQPVVVGEGYQEVSSYAWYTASTTSEESASETVVSPTHRTAWLGPDGSFVAHETRGLALDLDGNVVDGDYPPGGADATDRLPAGTVTIRGPSLPREPAALRAALTEAYQAADERTVAQLLVADVHGLFDLEVVPSDLAAACWRVLAAEPGVVSLGATTDRIGRTGEAVAVPMGTDPAMGVTVLVVSPEDGRLLQWESILTDFPDLGIDSPTVTGFEVFLGSRWVAEPGL